MIDRTFVIDSRKLDEVSTRLYGFVIASDDRIYIDELPPAGCTVSEDIGIYCLVKRDGDLIRIRQNYLGSFGLFVYENSDHFCISNSFFKLAEYLDIPLTADKRFLEETVYADDTILTTGRTFASDIKKLSARETVTIDIAASTYSTEPVPAKPFLKVAPDPEESLCALDRWYIKWVRILRELIRSPYPVISDLSGGLDTRIILSMLLNGNVDISSIAVKTNEFDTRKDTEDLRIATAISKDLGFSMNSPVYDIEDEGINDLDAVYNGCKYTTLGRSTLSKYALVDYSSPVFSLKGLASIIKGGPNGDRDPDLAPSYRIYSGVDADADQFAKVPPATRSMLLKRYLHVKEVFDHLLSRFDSNDPKKQASCLYARIEGEGRDVGKALDWMNANNYSISPFMDPEIIAFNNDPYNNDPLFLCTLIIDRYCPQLLDYPIEGPRAFKEASIEKARKINSGHPVSMPSFERVKKGHCRVGKKTVSRTAVEDYLRSAVDNDSLERIRKLIGDEKTDLLYQELLDLRNVNSLNQPANKLLAIHEFAKHCNL